MELWISCVSGRLWSHSLAQLDVALEVCLLDFTSLGGRLLQHEVDGRRQVCSPLWAVIRYLIFSTLIEDMDTGFLYRIGSAWSECVPQRTLTLAYLLQLPRGEQRCTREHSSLGCFGECVYARAQKLGQRGSGLVRSLRQPLGGVPGYLLYKPCFGWRGW